MSDSKIVCARKFQLGLGPPEREWVLTIRLTNCSRKVFAVDGRRWKIFANATNVAMPSAEVEMNLATAEDLQQFGSGLVVCDQSPL